MTQEPSREQIQGIVERITYHGEQSGYTVARLKTPRARDLVTIVGNFPNLQAGQTLALEGYWQDHKKFGPQFAVTRYRETKPATLTGLEKYLGSGLIKGIGPVTAKRIVAHFGLETLDIIEKDPARLGEVPGIARKRVVMIAKAWETQKVIQEVMLFLTAHGVSTTYAVKIFKHYGADSVRVVSDNPYRLALDVYGIGFVTADRIARSLGTAPDSEFRYRTGLLHILETASEEGHCFLPQTELIQKAVACLTLDDHQPDPTRLLDLTTRMAVMGELVMQGGFGEEEGQFICYKPVFYNTEDHLAQRIRRLLDTPLPADLERVKTWTDRFTAKHEIQLSDQQRLAVELSARERVLVLTGGPGCGKTFTTRTIVALWKAMGKTVALASPTGRAAQRLSELTGQEAKTLHRLLEFDPQTMGFKRDHTHPLEADAVVIDEASMLDLFLANSLFKALAPQAQILLVGDTDQLPSVGPGQVLQDLITSRQVPIVRLNIVFRQAQTSQIVSNAHRINQGLFPQLEAVCDQPQTDCLWLAAPEPETGSAGIQNLVQNLIPRLGFDPLTEVQVLSPMLRGEVGTRNLNQLLQATLNPPAPHKNQTASGGLIFRVTDRVIQQVNDYTREVFNGDLGTITKIDPEEQEITVQFGDRSVLYDQADLNEITLAWAVSIHKSQGSEYPVVILPVYSQHYALLSRNLIYTGLTRAKKLAILVGPAKALTMAIRQTKALERYTYLDERLIWCGAEP